MIEYSRRKWHFLEINRADAPAGFLGSHDVSRVDMNARFSLSKSSCSVKAIAKRGERRGASAPSVVRFVGG